MLKAHCFVIFCSHNNCYMKVIEEAAVVWKEQPDLAALRGRTKLMGGDFFKPETLPLGQDGDVYFLRTIIHDCRCLTALIPFQLFPYPILERSWLLKYILPLPQSSNSPVFCAPGLSSHRMIVQASIQETTLAYVSAIDGKTL